MLISIRNGLYASANMTQASCVANGSSLEDCHTNFFALADLCGIKWRQYSCDINFNDLNDDPILNSYAKCVNANLLCVWRRVRTQNSQEQPIRDLYINYSKELWIFWYGDEPDLKEIIYCNLKGKPNKKNPKKLLKFSN